MSDRPERPTATAVVAALNEEDNLPVLYDRLAPILDELFSDWEIVVVDDGSVDRTAAVLRELHERDGRVRAVRLTRNFGSHAAIAAGLDHAHGEVAVILAADLQDPPEVIREFVARWREGYEIVWGAREAREDPLLRRLFAKGFYTLIRRAALPGIPATGTGSFCLIDRSVIASFRRFQERNRLTFGIISWSGFAQAQVPYKRAARHAGTSKWSFGNLVKAAVDTFVSFSYLPIRLISYFGMAISVLAFVFAVYVLGDYIVNGTALKGWPSLMGAILLLGGVQLVTLGVIGEYVWRIAEESKQRPLYLVRERVGAEPAEESEPVRLLRGA